MLICVCVLVKKHFCCLFLQNILCTFQDEFHTFESPITLFSGDADVVPMKRDCRHNLIKHLIVKEHYKPKLLISAHEYAANIHRILLFCRRIRAELMACWVKVDEGMQKSPSFSPFKSGSWPFAGQACIITLLLSPVHMRFSLHTDQMHFCAEKRIYALQLYSCGKDANLRMFSLTSHCKVCHLRYISQAEVLPIIGNHSWSCRKGKHMRYYSHSQKKRYKADTGAVPQCTEATENVQRFTLFIPKWYILVN